MQFPQASIYRFKRDSHIAKAPWKSAAATSIRARGIQLDGRNTVETATFQASLEL